MYKIILETMFIIVNNILINNLFCVQAQTTIMKMRPFVHICSYKSLYYFHKCHTNLQFFRRRAVIQLVKQK